ncbi:unnamed protein product, partial [Mesorhabditis belari]|uniref:serine C-palmitoyltransferase n=1 Tax=Mesorhabditis belari TaxID=2138241 RepID=A0AAF3FL55_9BILA
MTRQLTTRTGILKHSDEPRNEQDCSEKSAASNGVSHELRVNGKAYTNGYNWKTRERSPNEFEKVSRLRALTVFISWFTLIVFAYLRRSLRQWGFEKNHLEVELEKQKDFVPLFSNFDSLYQRDMYVRVRDAFERPIASTPGATVNLLDRYTDDGYWSFKYTGTQTEVINLGSYNYLGFAQNEGPCADAAAAKIDHEGVAVCCSIHENGRSASLVRLEALVARFVGVDDAICFSMGFATNSMNAPALVDKHSVIVSDERNHASLILGSRLSGATIKVFKHNDMKSLEKTLRDVIAYGNPKTDKPYTKILIIVEGIYSMEGSIANLPEIIRLKKKYGAYLYLDEAHSIGAMGRSGRGIVEYWGCNPKDVDILMGTFSKSFGAVGGYIAGSKKIIDHLRVSSPTGCYSTPISPALVEQIYTSMSIIMGLDGTKDGESRIERLARNSRYFRLRLKQLGYIVYGSDDSPVVPVILYAPTVCGYYGREMLVRGVGTVVVSHPATDMTEGRIRFCVSNAHTKEQLDVVLRAMEELGEKTGTSSLSKCKKLYKGTKIEW